MLTEVQFTEARTQFSTLYDQVYTAQYPVIVKRKQTEEVTWLRKDQLKALLLPYNFGLEVISEEDGSITMALDCLELYANNETEETAMCDLVADLKQYAHDYIHRAQLFMQAPNRKGHYPYILRVLLCDDEAEIRGMLGGNNAS